MALVSAEGTGHDSDFNRQAAQIAERTTTRAKMDAVAFASIVPAVLRSRVYTQPMFARPVRALLVICRFRFLITAAWVCHLLVAPQLVTSQLLSSSSLEFPSVAGLQPPEIDLPLLQAEQNSPPPSPPTAAPSPGEGEEVLMRSAHQEKVHDVYTLRGDAQVNYRNYVLRGDEITYNPKTGDSTATGHVVFDGGPHDEHIEASHGTYNLHTEKGRFYDVSGTTGMRFKGLHVVLTTSNPFAFTGKVVDKLGPDRFVVHHGTVTSCNVPHPKWVFSSTHVVLDVGGTAKIYNSLFRIKGVPVFYFPFADHPVAHMGRQSGFLMPTFGTSSRKGTVLGEGFYWAINRSMDVTVGADYYSQRGWAQNLDFRAVPSQHSSVAATYYGVIDRGFGRQKIKQGGEDVRVVGSATFGDGYRAVGNIDYLSSYIFRLAFNELFTQPVQSEIISTAFLSRNFNGFSGNVMVQRYQDFQSAAPGNFISIWHTPSIEFSSVDRRLRQTPLYWSFDTALEGVSRSQPGFVTKKLVGRFDLRPDLSLPIMFHDWMFRPEIALRDTAYTEDVIPTPAEFGIPGSQPINRKAFEGTFELRPPALARLFDRELFGRKLKHVIEPQVIYRYVTGVNNFSNILRFDGRDVLTNTNEVEYGLTTRLFAKKISPESEEECTPPCDSSSNPTSGLTSESKPPESREIITWRVGQKYFFDKNFGGALIPGHRNVFDTTIDFAGIAFLDEPRSTSPVISRLTLQSGHGVVGWDLDYDTVKGRVSSSTTLLGYTFGPFYLAGSHSFIQSPGEASSRATLALPLRFDQFRVMLRYGNPNRRGINAAGYIGVDANLNFIQFSVYQATYNWDCCGLTFELRRFAIGPVRTDNQYRFAFSLANIGTFGNLRKQERLF
jgi:LPS-assembly protein